MRRHDREITDFEEITDIMKKCDVCRVAMRGGEYPYILPLNFGMSVDGSGVTLYFHGAMEGLKYEYLSRDGRVCFEMDCEHELHTDADGCTCTMSYESVIGYGVMEELHGSDKKAAMDKLMAHYDPPTGFHYNEALLEHTRMLALRVESMTGKRRPKK